VNKRGHFYWSTDIPWEDILAEMDDDDLIEELKERRAKIPRDIVDDETKKDDYIDMIEGIRRAFAGGDGLHFEVLMIRLENALGVRDRVLMSNRILPI
jgi:hypothetical protein